MILVRRLFERLLNPSKHLLETLATNHCQLAYSAGTNAGLSRLVVYQGQFSEVVALTVLPYHTGLSLLIHFLSS